MVCRPQAPGPSGSLPLLCAGTGLGLLLSHLYASRATPPAQHRRSCYFYFPLRFSPVRFVGNSALPSVVPPLPYELS